MVDDSGPGQDLRSSRWRSGSGLHLEHSGEKGKERGNTQVDKEVGKLRRGHEIGRGKVKLVCPVTSDISG